MLSPRVTCQSFVRILSLCNLSYSYDDNIFMEFYASLPSIVSSDFSTNIVLKRHWCTFSWDDIVELLSLSNVKDTSFLIISFKFENLTKNYLHNKFSLVNECNLIDMENQLVRLEHSYVGSAFTVNKDALITVLMMLLVQSFIPVNIINQSPYIEDNSFMVFFTVRL